ncbi:metallophosphoesterase family protein [Desulfospira joergensenii]|uniref:metallophosphoesterase family protein n=1 Tax=Desulfospira joergensenii TaxID=53329 RepID=UPI0003B601C7|nr:YfcE family phosphodiesterase [Desulfospira joergensenii]
MNRLFITADVHGNFSTWLTVRALLEPGDGLVIAGDLFDTRYGSFSHPDFRPDSIRQDILSMESPFYYVYGNCDVPAFLPGYDHCLELNRLGKKIFLHHGHARPALPRDSEIVIQGHTHFPHLEKKNKKIFVNPGSITSPRNQTATYGIMDREEIRILELKTGKVLFSLNFE